MLDFHALLSPNLNKSAKQSIEETNRDPSQSKLLWEQMGDVAKDLAAGTVGGAAQLVVGHPFDTIKVKLQSQPTPPPGQPPKFAGAMDAVKQTISAEGPRGLFKGLVPTMAREIPGNALMFGVYEATKQFIAGGQDTSELGRGSLILAGGVAGAAFWGSVYPTDVVKSKLQVDDFKNPKYSGSMDAFKKILAADGARGLYRGFGPAMARSVPANGACFLAYEVTRSLL
uniref:Mitochondrial carnitine/acylcarnitine carrier-like protein n=1 Tax=Aegilops tauschii subsp. strangulata TaxID=200361 RepID=A0A452YQ45_AEGTS